MPILSLSPPCKLLMKNPLLLLLQRPVTLAQVLQIHGQMIVTNLVSDTFTMSRLIAASTVSVWYAELIFSQILEPDIFCWNTLIRAHGRSLNPGKALGVYDKMRKNGVLTDNYTYPFVIKACAMASQLEAGKAVHGEVLKRGFVLDLIVRNGLINMYCKCWQLDLARKVFDEMTVKDLVTWNSLLGGYVGVGDMRNAQKLFDEMIERDVFSWAMMIDGYGKKIGGVNQARKLFDAMPTRDVVCWNSMIGSYVSVGDMTLASKLFDEMPTRSVVSWSIMVNGQARHGEPIEALNLFQQMLHQKIRPDKVAVAGALVACAQLGALDEGKWIHHFVIKYKLLDVVVRTALIEMYMKCGSLDRAWEVFENMMDRNVISWSVMMVGLGMNGRGEDALSLFFQMEREGYLIDDLAFLGILSACSHSGLIHEGLQIFRNMKEFYGIEPKSQHYGCLVDMFGRAGLLDQAVTIIRTMPVNPDSVTLASLLAACRIHKRMDLAEVLAEHLVEEEGEQCAVHVLQSNMYAEEEMWDDVLKARNRMIASGVKKEAGRSVIEVDGHIHEFISGTRLYHHEQELCSVIWGWSRMITCSASD